MKNPFSAPQHDSPPPVDEARRWLTPLAIVEIVMGVGLALLSARGAQLLYESTKGVDLRRFVVVETITVSAGLLFLVSGWTLLKRTGRVWRYLQIAPAVLTFGFLVSLALR